MFIYNGNAFEYTYGSRQNKDIFMTKDIDRIMVYMFKTESILKKGAQWLSGRVLDWRPRGRGFEPYRRHCIMVLEQDTFILA